MRYSIFEIMATSFPIHFVLWRTIIRLLEATIVLMHENKLCTIEVYLAKCHCVIFLKIVITNTIYNQ